MSVLLTMPTTSRRCEASTLLACFSFIRFSASSVNYSLSRITTFVLIKFSTGMDRSSDMSSGT